MQIKRFNWLRSPTGWERMQAWQARRRAMREDFEAANDLARSGFATAWSNQISGLADLAAQAARARISAAVRTKIDKSV